MLFDANYNGYSMMDVGFTTQAKQAVAAKVFDIGG